MWIAKPDDANRGIGIKVVRDLESISEMIDKRHKFTYLVVQKYIERPLLYKGRKFDIRVWATATSEKEFFFCNEGYIRTSSFDYTNDLENDLVHLTNNAMQVKD